MKVLGVNFFCNTVYIYYRWRIGNRTQALNGTIFNDLEWSLTQIRGYNNIQRQITQKRCQIELYLQWRINRKSYMVYRTAPVSMTLNNPTPSFKVTPLFYAEYLRNGTRYRHCFNEMLIGTYTCSSQECYFEWPWVTLGDLAKYSMTWSVARSLCDSWASCSLDYSKSNSQKK